MATVGELTEAILLLGPTGSGKSPLGDLLATRGWPGRRCVHLDFGAQLRRVAAHGGSGLTAEQVGYVGRVLRDGLLLEDDRFDVARAILRAFLRERAVGAPDLVVLNGLPRHVGQARDLEQVFDIVLVVALQCDAATVHARIVGDSGGDRGGRTDDSVMQIERKLRTYAARTQPLLDHYRRLGVLVRAIEVGVDTTAALALQALGS